MNILTELGELEDEAEDSSQAPNRYLIARNLDPKITPEHLESVFSSYDGFIEAFLVLPAGVVRARGYVKYATAEQTLHVMTVFSREHPEWKGYLEYGGLVKKSVPVKKPLPVENSVPSKVLSQTKSLLMLELKHSLLLKANPSRETSSPRFSECGTGSATEILLFQRT
ncbi:hypothetical protein BDZ45DRAFT_426054 [Acephala macrosclerotiorum]|nr:hypothetical protein BDZ45DRAFT_426054 [Acephala macrosclerotiorum]